MMHRYKIACYQAGLFGRYECSCGWKSRLFWFGSNAISEFVEHLRDINDSGGNVEFGGEKHSVKLR